MSRFSWFAWWILASWPVFGAVDLGPLKAIAGNYPVLDWNGEARAAGALEIVADARGVGYVLQPLAMASHPVPSEQWLAGTDGTTLAQQGDLITQDSVVRGNRLHIEYRAYNGYLQIVSRICPPNSETCAHEQIGLTSGKATGDPMTVEAFIQAVQGSYKIDLVGGQKPKELDDTADVSPDDGQGVLTLPYCAPGAGTCDPGYIFLHYDKAQIFHRALAAGDDLYTILQTVNGKLFHYSWENNQGAITFRNFQYALRPGQPVALEYQLHKI